MSSPADAPTSPSPFQIFRLESEISQQDYVRLSFPKSGNRPNGSATMLVSEAHDTRRMKAAVLDGGGSWPLVDAKGSQLENPVTALPEEAGILAATTGWKGEGAFRWFCMPDRNLGTEGRPTFLDSNIASLSLASGSKGSRRDWTVYTAHKARLSPIASMAMLAVFASALLPFSKLREGFILNIAGDGSGGKTTANIAAASIWGHRNSMADWNSSISGITDRAAANTHIGLVLDDAEKASPKPNERLKVLQDLTHLLTSGKSRSYSKVLSGKDQLATHKFETIILSSSPFSVENFMSSLGQERTDGDRARLLELVIPKDETRGIWLPINEREQALDTQQKSDELFNDTQKYYGTAGPAFVAFLLQRLSTLEPDIERHTAYFLKHCGPQSSNVAGRIADKVALLYAAGRLARKAGILMWSKRRLLEVTQWGLKQILAASRAQTLDFTAYSAAALTCLGDTKKYGQCGSTSVTKYKWAPETSGFVSEKSGTAYARREALMADLATLIKKELTVAQDRILLSHWQKTGCLEVGEAGGHTKTIRYSGGKNKMLVFNIAKLKAEANAKAS